MIYLKKQRAPTLDCLTYTILSHIVACFSANYHVSYSSRQTGFYPKAVIKYYSLTHSLLLLSRYGILTISWAWIYVCKFKKIISVILSRFCQNVKRGSLLWNQIFSVHFFVTNMRKIVSATWKNAWRKNVPIIE